MQINGIELKWLGHAGFLIKNSRVIYIDPYQIKNGSEKADLILITHSHYDHCSVADMQKIVKNGTKIIMTADCQSKITRFDVTIEMEIAEPGQELELRVLIEGGDLDCAQLVGEKLGEMGCKLAKIDMTRGSEELKTTTVYHAEGFEQQAQGLAASLGADTVVKRLSADSTFDLVVMAKRSDG